MLHKKVISWRGLGNQNPARTIAHSPPPGVKDTLNYCLTEKYRETPNGGALNHGLWKWAKKCTWKHIAGILLAPCWYIASTLLQDVFFVICMFAGLFAAGQRWNAIQLWLAVWGLGGFLATLQ